MMMKKWMIIVSLILFCSQGFAISVISGKWQDAPKDKISLYEVTDGAMKEIATSLFSEEADFSFAFNPKVPAFYVIGISPTNSRGNFTFYLKPGDNLKVEIENINSYKLIGENTPENQLLTRWHNLIKPMNAMSFNMGQETMLTTYVDFFPLLEDKLEEIAKVDWNSDCPAGFSAAFEDFRTFDLLNTALTFVYMPRTAHPQGEDFPDYYHDISLAKLTSTDFLLHYPYGMLLLNQIRLNTASRETEGKSKKEIADRMGLYAALDADLAMIGNEGIKAALVLDKVKAIKTHPGFINYEERYGKYLTTETQRFRLREFSKNLVKNETGSPAFNFSYEDINGKQVTLSGLKGKVVYVDLWATWCAPCKKEIPYLKELEKEYHGKNIVFVSISIDSQKDHEKWKKFVAQEELSGIQLFAGNRAKEIQQPYGIETIPAFLLIGADGNLINGKAPRPSSPEIRPLLNDILK